MPATSPNSTSAPYDQDDVLDTISALLANAMLAAALRSRDEPDAIEATHTPAKPAPAARALEMA